jgi:putative ABC transport system permease protein
MFAKNPGFTAVVVLTLALGIGANTTVFSVVNGMWLKPLGYPEPGRLVCLFAANPRLMAASPTEGWDRSNVSANDFVDWREQSRSFVDMGICRYTSCNLTGGDHPERVIAARASAGLLPVLGSGAKVGRIFGPSEDRPGNEQVALLSDGFWQRRFGGDPGIVGQTIMLDGAPFEVLGVLPAGLTRAWGRFDHVWGRFDVWTPFAFDAGTYSRGDRSFKALGRLKPGVSIAEAQAEMEAIASRLAKTYPESNEGYTVNVMPLFDSIVGDEAKQALSVLIVAVGLVLLIACVNVANLLLARGSTRSREFAVRAALGASRGRMVRQMITECTVLSLVGAALGALMALWGVEVLLAILPDTVPRKHEIGVDRGVLLFTLGLSFAAAVLFGLVPSLKGSRVNLNEMLKEGAHPGSAGEVRRLKRDFLIVGQIAMALGLVVSAGLMTKSFLRLRDADLGFDARQLLTMRTRLSGEQYQSDEKRTAFFKQATRKIRANPGVTSAAAVSSLPCDWLDTWDYATIEEYTERHPGRDIFLGRITVTPGYFETMRIPILSGRDFTGLDNPESRDVVIVNETLAQRFWPGEDAIGKRLKYGPRDSGAPWLTVVGVVGDVKQRGLTRETRLETYRPHAQRPEWRMSCVVRTVGDPLAATGGVQNAVWDVDPDRAVYRVRSMEDIVFDQIGASGIMAGLLTAFAMIALILAAVGLYGVMSYAVGQRTPEIGIRVALGARASDILRLVIRRAILLTMVGVAVGIGLALLLGQVLEALLYGVSPTDPSTFIGVAVMLLVVGFTASYLPARWATKVDPMVALRCE